MSVSSDDPEVVQAILDSYGRILVENYCIIASSALLFADTFMTITDEVQRIWRRRFTGATAVFLITRYVAVAERIVLLVSVFLPTVEDEGLHSCVPVLRLDDALTDISYLMFGVFLMLRARGIWGKGWIPILILALLTPVRPLLSLYNQVHYTPIAFGGPLYGCGAVINNTLYSQLGIASRAAGLAIDATVLTLTWIRTLGMQRESRRLGLHTPLVTLLLRDGTLYFLTILVIQICGIVSVSVGNSFVLWDVWPYFDQVFTVIFSCRFMLDLRGVYLADPYRSQDDNTLTDEGEHGTGGVLSGLRFSASVVGNMGAPLDTFGRRSHGRSFSGGSSARYSWNDGRSDRTSWSAVPTERESEESEGMETSTDPLFVGLYYPTDIELPDTPTTAVA
ncbi:hypothetical protein C8Q77DRAFT_1067798 [Trametes polyzona]|nr:hypothetical protein C8Q77DRAFT_1067798 [Trametes polyzona]